VAVFLNVFKFFITLISNKKIDDNYFNQIQFKTLKGTGLCAITYSELSQFEMLYAQNELNKILDSILRHHKKTEEGENYAKHSGKEE